MFCKRFLPNFSICANLALIVVVYLDLRNPMMGFLEGWPFLILCGTAVLASIATAVVLYAETRRRKNRKYRKAAEKAASREENEKNS